MERARAVEHLERIIETVESEEMPVPIRELWVFGELALGLDPLERMDIYLTKDILIDGSSKVAQELEDRFDVAGIGTVVRESWATAHPEHIRTNPNGYVAPEKCLGAHLLPADEPIHLEVCNAGFESNVTQRLEAAVSRDTYEELLDPRAVCVWRDGVRSDEALEKLRDGAYVFPTLEEALSMLGLDDEEASAAADTLISWKADLEGQSVRGDVI